ncbi:MAG: YgjV family protein [Clostridia bacterium]
MYALVAQGLGIVAMICSVMSFQLDTKKKIIIMQIVTSIIFATHYFMIGAITAAVVNMIAILRNGVFYKKNTPFTVTLFCIIMAGSALLSWQGPISLLMCVGMIFNTLAVAAKMPVDTRKRILISSPFVLIYNIFVFSIGGIINESAVIIITTVTLIKELRKK